MIDSCNVNVIFFNVITVITFSEFFRRYPISCNNAMRGAGGGGYVIEARYHEEIGMEGLCMIYYTGSHLIFKMKDMFFC